MAATDPTTTSRLRVSYTGPFGTHTMLFHGELAQSEADLVGDVADFVDVAGALQFVGTVWSTAEYAAEGSPLFFPTSLWDPITVSASIGPDTGNGPANFLQFGGRDSTAGVRVKLYLYEVRISANSAMKVAGSANAAVQAVITELQSIDNTISNIAGRVPVWYEYANIGQNDFLTHKARH